MGSLLLTAAAAFAATNLDDILLLCLLFGRTDTPKDKARIALGQCLGLAALTLLGWLGGRGLAALPEAVLRLLGLVPLALGLRMMLRRQEEASAALPLSALGVAGLALANGGDNLGVYAPLFAQLTLGESALTALVFGLMTLLWCFLGATLSGLPPVERFLRRWGRELAPVVLVLLGISILMG